MNNQILDYTRKKLHNLLGFTLVEIMVTAFLFLMISGSILAFLIIGYRCWFVGSDYTFIQQQARVSINKMSNELFLSKPGMDYGNIQIFEDLSGSSIKFKVPVKQEYETIIPEINVINSYYNSQGDINWGAEGELDWSIRYYVDTNTGILKRDVLDADGNIVSSINLASNISSVEFLGSTGGVTIYDNPASVDIKVTSAKETLFNESLDYELSSSLVFRN